MALTEASLTQPYRYTHPETEHDQKMLGPFDEHRGHPWIEVMDEEIQGPASYQPIFG